MIGFPPSVRRVAVLGDIGGQLAVLRRVLAELGASSGRLPDDLAVVQVGDLVRFGDHGLDNAGCVSLAEYCRVANPGRWMQLLGNHDMALLGGPRRPSWSAVSIDDGSVQTLRRWWGERQAQLAVAVRCQEHGDVLITHAGLTRGRWRRLGSPPEPFAAADLLNADVGKPVSEAIHGGALADIDAGPEAERADVTWAEVIDELYGPWLAAGDIPFPQIHGHASPWNWTTGTWWPTATPAIRAATSVDTAARRTTTRLGSTIAIGVDWTLGNEPSSRVWPLLTLTQLVPVGAEAGSS